MSPDEKKAQVASMLNKVAAEEVQDAHKDTISAAPADPEIVDLTFESELLRYASEWLAVNKTKASGAKPFALVFSRSIEADIGLLKSRGVHNPAQYRAFHSQKLLAVPGCVIVVTVNLERALIVPVKKATNSQHLLDAMTALGLSERQMAVFEPPVANMVLLRWGLNGKSRSQAVVAPGARPPLEARRTEGRDSSLSCGSNSSAGCCALPLAKPRQRRGNRGEA